VRELHEETGLVLGECRGDGLAADLGALHYICRAVTPGRRPIRFNARFLAAPAERVQGEIAGSGELERLDWYTPEAAHRHHVADITGKVLVEFLDWLDRSPRARAARALIVFRGMDNRHQER
jgi:8-oxo-dGTP pyrophosphatase MutT (NUDIX family)